MTMIDVETLAQLAEALEASGVTSENVRDCLENNPSGFDAIAAILQIDTLRHGRIVHGIISNDEALRTIQRWLRNQAYLKVYDAELFIFRTSLKHVFREALMACTEVYVQSIDALIDKAHEQRKHGKYLPESRLFYDNNVSLKPLGQAVQRRLDRLNAKMQEDLRQYSVSPKIERVAGDTGFNRAVGILERSGFHHWTELTLFTEREIRAIRLVGDAIIATIRAEFAKYQLDFAPA